MTSSLLRLKCLSEIKSGEGIPFLTPDVSPGTHCPMRMASVIVEDIAGLSSLLVGMPECTTHSRLFNPYPEGEKGELHWLYVLDSREVVFGCRDGVMEALKKMEKAGAQSILLIATCIPDLIGEDFEGVIQEIQSELSIRVAFVTLGQFKNVSYPAGSWKTMEALVALMQRQITVPNRVNILGRSPKEDHTPLPFLFPFLERNGIELRCLAPGASLDDFRVAPDAVLNIVVSPYTQPLAVKMQKEFGVPFITLHNCYSVEEIDKAYERITKQFNLSCRGVFDEERKEALVLEKQSENICHGLKYVLSLRVDLPLPLTQYFITRLAMKPLLLHMEEYYPEDQNFAKSIRKSGYDPLVCRIVNEDSALQILQELRPDLGIGYLPNMDDTFPWVTDMFDFYGQVGYGRTTAVLKRLLCAINKSSHFSKGGTYGTSSI